MDKKTGVSLIVSAALLFGCADNADQDGDGNISKSERAEEMRRDGYLNMAPGRWKIDVSFSDINVPGLGRKERDEIKAKFAEGISGTSCLTAEEAARPGANFFGGAGTENCTYKQFDIAGNQVKMTISCGMGDLGKADIALDGTVEGQSFLFDSKTELKLPIVGRTTLIGKMNGKHDGKCTGEE